MSDFKNPFWIKFLPAVLQEKFSGRQNMFAIIHNSGWLILDKMTRALLGIVVGALVARYLGPEEFGELSYVLAILAFFQVVTTLGLDGIVVRDIASSSHNPGKTLGTAFLMRFIAGLGCWILAVAIMSFFFGLENRIVWLTAIAGVSLIFQAADVVDLWFQSQSQSRRTVLAKLTAYLISNGLRIFFIAAKLPLIFFALAIAVEFGATAVVLLLTYQRVRVGNKWEYEILTMGKKMIKESWPIILSGISIIIYMRIDQIMIRNFLGESELGIYSAILLISTGWYFIPSVLGTSLMPMLSKLKLEDERLYHKRLSTMFRSYLIISTMVCLFVIWQSGNLIQWIYGDKFIDGRLALSIHILSNIPVFLGFGQGLWVLNARKPRMFLIQTLAGGITSITLNFILIPKIGIIGASVSAVASQAASSVLTNFFIERNLFLLQLGITPRTRDGIDKFN